MKKLTLTIFFVVSLTTLIISSCGNKEQKTAVPPAEIATEQYQCPMKCTEELFDKPGKCPVCEMELEKITKS